MVPRSHACCGACRFPRLPGPLEGLPGGGPFEARPGGGPFEARPGGGPFEARPGGRSPFPTSFGGSPLWIKVSINFQVDMQSAHVHVTVLELGTQTSSRHEFTCDKQRMRRVFVGKDNLQHLTHPTVTALETPLSPLKLRTPIFGNAPEAIFSCKIQTSCFTQTKCDHDSRIFNGTEGKCKKITIKNLKHVTSLCSCFMQ